MKKQPFPKVDPDAYLYKTGPDGRQAQKCGPKLQPAVCQWPSVCQWMADFGTAHDLMSTAEKKARTWPTFAVLAIKQDKIIPAEADHTIALCDLQVPVKDAAGGAETLGGMLAPDLAMYWIAVGQEADLENLARRVAAGACQQVKDLSLSFGIASFPLGDFTAEQIPENACKALDHAAFFGPGSIVIFDSVSLNISGDRFYQEGDLEGAVNEYLKALELDRQNLNVRNSLGVCYARQGKLEEALEQFRFVAELDHGEAMAIYNIGLIHYIRNDRDKARRHWLQALELDDSIFEVHFQLGRLYAENKTWDKVLNHLARATELRPNSSPAQCLLGKCHQALGNRLQAIQAFKQAIKRNPNDAEALSNLGWLYHQEGKNSEISMIFCRQSVALDPENGLFHQRLASIYLQNGKHKEALEHFKLASDRGLDCSHQIAELNAAPCRSYRG